MKYLLQFFFWLIYFPLMRLFSLLLFWNRKLEERERFEKRNKFEWLAHSFKEIGEKADFCFEFSSEGEFQQVAPLIDDALKRGKKIELVFFSPSVEKAVMKLAQSHPEQIRYLRYPLVRIFPFIERRCFSHWTTSKKLILVRYDFFPEFLLWGMEKGHELQILWMTFKKERSQGRSPSFWKKLFLKHSRGVIYAGKADEEQGLSLGFPGQSFDFRMVQIHRRIQMRDEKFASQFKLYPEFKNHLSQYKRALIMGNAWPNDLFLLRDLPSDVLLVIVPHQLSHDNLNKFLSHFDQMGREVFELSDVSREFKGANTILVNKKGILCELYSDFIHAYVGGGFEGSIHSVLEPLVAGSKTIACGPRHHRSTEYDIAESLGKISEVNTPEQFMEWLKDDRRQEDHDKMKLLLSDYEKMREFVISC